MLLGGEVRCCLATVTEHNRVSDLKDTMGAGT